jgi:hypothetical protein
VRGDHIITPRGDTRFQPDDVVFVLAPVRLTDGVHALVNGEKMNAVEAAEKGTRPRPRGRATKGRRPRRASTGRSPRSG